MNVLDLFSGIGGFSLGLERAGMRTVAFCEIDSYCQAVLRKHWPDVPIYGDVRDLTAEVLADPDESERQARDGITVGNGAAPQRDRGTAHGGIDVICGGFPCQDISVAGKGVGINGSRSGLWAEYARIIGEVRPRYVIVENVAALLGRGIERVLGDLAALGYDAEWHCIPAYAVGAPHRRDRVWIVAYPRCVGRDGRGGECDGPQAAGTCDRTARSGQHSTDVAYPDQPRLEGWLRRELQECAEQWFARAGGAYVPDAESGRRRQGPQNGGRRGEGNGTDQWSRSVGGGWWLAEPNMGRVAHGVPSRVDRLRALGNAIVPQIAEIIGRAIVRAEGERSR